tara:strand:+ start:573 stop:1454 length:882 start_codon:yes stop_codon:yes gene_type:complete
MPNRSKISKQVSRRGGGYPTTKKGTTVDEINRMRDEWEDDPDFKGTPGPYNIRKKVHKKKKKKNPFGLRVTPRKSKPAGSAMTTTDTRKKVIPKRPRRSAARDAQSITVGRGDAGTASRVVHPRQPIPDIVRPKPKRYSETPVHMMDPIEPEITAKRRREQAQRDAARRAGQRGSSRMPAFKATDIDAPTRIKDEARQAKGDASLAERLAAEERRIKAIKDEEEKIELTPEQRARLKALQRKRNVDSDATYTASKKGGQLKKKKTKAKSKSYKKAKKTYGGHHGGKLVASLYD